ncbi:MAG: hypothetical protein RIS47_826, partial [Bacteroidota bacterium]
LDLQIVPAGIFYSNYVSPMAVLRVHYGKSFGIAHYKDLYQSNKDEAIRQLTKEMETRIRAEIIHIAQRNYYTTINRAADIYANTLHPNSSNKAFFARKEIAEKLDMLRPEQGSEAFEYLEKILTNFDNLLKELHFTEREYISPINTKQVFSNALGCLIALPFVLLGVFVNSFPIAITELLTRTMTKDPEFIASYRITFSAILFPVNTLIISILLAKFIGLYAFLLLGTIPFLAHFSLRYGLNLLYFARNVAFIRAKARKQTNELAVLHNCIIAHIQQLTRQEKP